MAQWFSTAVDAWRSAAGMAAAEVLQRLLDFLVAVHDERAVADHGLVDRFSRQPQQRGVVVGFQVHAVRRAVHVHQLAGAGNLLSVDQHRAVQHHQRQRVAGLGRKLGGGTGIEPHIPHVDGREGPRGPLAAKVVTGDDAQMTRAVRQRHLRDVGIQQVLVAGGGHLVLGRQVDPQLHHLQRAAAPGKGFGVVFLVQDARGRRHPLHVARADGAAGARGVTVGHFALVDDGHGLEAAVRVRSHAAPRRGGREVLGARMVQQQEGAQGLAVVAIAEQRAHGKTVAHPVGTRGFVDTQDFLEHGVSPCGWPAVPVDTAGVEHGESMNLER